MQVTRTPLPKEALKKRLLVSYADKRLLSTRQDYLDIKEYFLDRTVGIPRYVKRKLANRYTDIHNERQQKWANVWLREATKTAVEILKNCPFKNKKALIRHEIIEEYARQAVNHCTASVGDFSANIDSDSDYRSNLMDVYGLLASYLKSIWKINAPYSHVEEKTEQHYESAILRMCCDFWWLRKLTRIKNHTNEHLLIALGEVRKGRGGSPYVSFQTFNEWKQQQKANREYLQAMEIVNVETNETMPLEEIADATTANPEKRRIELMVRCRGLEELAEDDGHSALFLTLTAPSKYHATSKKYSGCSPKDTQSYLVGIWSRIRAKLSREEIDYYGVRVVEPHHDATPHWHLLLFVNPAHEKDLINICKAYALKEDGNEKGAQKHRFTVEKIDPEKGSATGYIAKYISKNINGSKMDDANNIDLEAETTAPEGAQRATAWASRWNIRQFQFFGAASVSLYREFRRLDGEGLCPEVNRVRVEADAARWAEFTKALRGNDFRVAYDSEQGGNKYGEETRRISGIVTPFGVLPTRLEKYALRKRGSGSPWSPVNNCTLSDSEATALSAIGIPEELKNEFLHGARVRVDEKTVYRVVNGTIDEIRA